MKRPAQSDEIVAAACEVLGRIAPLVHGHAKFDVRVTSRLLKLLERDLNLADAARSAERRRLRTLLRETEEEGAGIEMLRAQLCERIANAAPDLDEAGLIEHLWSTALAQLAIDSPDYQFKESLQIQRQGSV